MTLEIPGAYFVTENGKRTLVATTFRAGGTVDFNNQVPTNTFEAMRAFLGNDKPPLILTGLPAWTTAATANGSVVGANVIRQVLRVTTDITPDSTILSRLDLYGLNSNSIAQNKIDWGKKMSVYTTLTRDTSNAAAVSFFQIKEATTIGQIAAKGIEVKISNLAMEGYAYGTSLSSAVAMGNLTSGYPSVVRIDITPSGVEFFVGSVSKGTITTAGKFPTGAAGAASQCVFSHDNGNTATQCDFYAGQVIIFQEA